jgi:hypothetical protein
VKLVVGLIKECVEQKKPITREDIIKIYTEFYIKTGKKFKEYEWLGWTNTPQERWFEVDRDRFSKHWKTSNNAKQWFKNNLAAAIIAGKLLVIPVIEIE